MEFSCPSTPLAEWSGDTLGVGLFQGETGERLVALEARFGPGLQALL